MSLMSSGSNSPGCSSCSWNRFSSSGDSCSPSSSSSGTAPLSKSYASGMSCFFFLSFNSAANICMYKAYFLLVEGPLEGPGLLLFGPPRGFLARLLKLRPQLGPLFLALGRLRAASI
jgi:hypothetical protein